MATLTFLKQRLKQNAVTTTSHPMQPLSDAQYRAGFEILLQNSGRAIYHEFIISQLLLLLSPLLNSRSQISILEVGPGPKSVLGALPSWLRRKIEKYTAFEPNDLFATDLEDWLCSASETGSPLSCLQSPPTIHRIPFSSDSYASTDGDSSTSGDAEKFDVVLFCHSMYGMQPKRRYLERALKLLIEQPEGAMVVVFHREGSLRLDGLPCHRTASFPAGVIDVVDDDNILNRFARFVTGFDILDANADNCVQVEWRNICRALGRRDKVNPDHLFFSSPNIMATFTPQATTLPELTAQVPSVSGERTVKNRQARRHHPASVMRPTEIRHIEDCVRWARNHKVGLTIIGGGHSGNCVWPNVVSIDMAAFDQIHILKVGERISDPTSDAIVVAEAGSKSGDIVRKTIAAGLIVPLGARPSVGAGLWLQGGIGHLTRLHGLTCDAIIGAVVVSVASGRTLYVGHVPSQHRPVDAVRPENEGELLWAIRGAGTNFGIVVSVTFKTYTAPTYLIRNWVIPLNNKQEARLQLGDFDELVAKTLPRSQSADAYLYWDIDKLHLGVTVFESSTTLDNPAPAPRTTYTTLGRENHSENVDSVGLFESEMYVSGMHGGHVGGKTSSFKRCLFLKGIGVANVTDILVAAMETRPSPFCYLHLLQGGGAVGEVADDATAFGCRGWDFACVITGVWPRDQDGTEVNGAAVQWVYDVVKDLLPLSRGVYGADLGPDPRDATLASKAFGANRPRLARLKRKWDPDNVLAYACPLMEAPFKHKLIILVTGESCAGKDYCADIWVSMFTTHSDQGIKARSVSISDTVKREYATSTGADAARLLSDRAYKERHRSTLSMYFQNQTQQRPQLPEEHFLSVVHGAADVDVLLITGMRDQAPVAAFSHLVPDSRMLEVSIKASKLTRDVRRGCQGYYDESDDNKINSGCPSLTFNNDMTGPEAAERFFEDHLLPFVHGDIERLASMVRSVPNFPRPGIEFRHVLDISQQPGGLTLCTSLLQAHFIGCWENVTAVACCEIGGFVYASALAARVGVPMALIREAGKLPPPTVSVVKLSSHISSPASSDAKEKRIEMNLNVISRGASVVVVDDVLATGKTLCAVLQLLREAGICVEDVSVLVVAEFPFHRGRDLLRRHGFGRTKIQSLLVFGGA